MKKNKNLSSLIKKAKEKEVSTKKQEVRPIKDSVMKNEKMFSLYMPEDVLIELKILAARENTTIKSLINTAVKDKYGF